MQQVVPQKCILVIVLLLPHYATADLPLPSPRDLTVACSSCGGHRNWHGKDVCMSHDCIQRCESERSESCYKSPSRNLGCCCNPANMPQGDAFKCERFVENGTCVWSCCKAYAFGDLRLAPVMCGRGCCPPGDHGSRHKCGRSLDPVGRNGKHASCCVPQESTPEEQRESKCCIIGTGVDCTEHNQKVACCLDPSNVFDRDADPYTPCQPHNCSHYKTCPRGLGFNCIGRAGQPKSRGKKRCCPSGVSPSIHDPCQLAASDCETGGRYSPCPSKLGLDCASPTRTVCCISSDNEASTCRSDCGSYKREQLHKYLKIFGVVAVFLALATVILYKLRHTLRRCFCRCCRSGRGATSSSSILLPAGLMHAQGLKEHSVRIALVMSGSNYLQGTDHRYDILPNANRDAYDAARTFRELGYDVECIPDATCDALHAGFKRAVQKASGKDDALIVSYFSGHAVEKSGALKWAGVDAQKNQPDKHLDMVDLCMRLQDVHLEDGARKLGCSKELKRAYFVFLADCCRTLPGEDVLNQFISHWETTKQSNHRSRMRPGFYFLYAADPGHSTTDGPIGSHSRFLQEILKQLPLWQSLDSFAGAVASGLKESTSHRMRLWRRETCGDESHCISLAPPPVQRSRSSSIFSDCSSTATPSSHRFSRTSSSSRSSVASQLSVASSSSGTDP